MSYNSHNDILTSINGTSIGGFRNRVINGDMRIDQANAGASITVSNSVSFSVDLFKAQANGGGGVFTVQQSTNTPPVGTTNFIRTTVTTADASPAVGSLYCLFTDIEGVNLQDMQFGTSTAKVFTLSFQVRSSLTGSFGGAIRNGGGTRSYPFSFTINTANVWQLITLTIQGDFSGTWATDTGIGLDMRIDLGCGSSFLGAAGAWVSSSLIGVTSSTRLISTLSATFDLTDVQLEPGPLATTFEVRDWTSELLRCLRYLWKPTATAAMVFAMGQMNASVTALYAFQSPVTMRVAPSITFSTAGNFFAQAAGLNFTPTALGTSSTTPTNSYISATVVGGVAGQATALIWQANTAFIQFDSRM